MTENAAAWAAIVLLGAYHGLNPGMGWLLAVSTGLQARRAQRVPRPAADRVRALPRDGRGAHGAGLMLVPIVLGLCTNGTHDTHFALGSLAGSSLGVGLAASAVHTAAMVLAGGLVAWAVYRYVGLGILQRAWVNVDLAWSVLLIAVGAIALAASA